MTKKHIHIASLESLDWLSRRLKRIGEEEAGSYHLLGSPFGESLEHCIFLGLKYCKNFEKEVKYYVIRENLPSDNERRVIASEIKRVAPWKNFVAIDFYGDRR
jgi:hypothetical protein